MTEANSSIKVRVAGLSKEFQTGRGALPALRDVSFSVATGEFVALTGKSGCGKTTALRIVMGLERPTGGVVEVGGRVVDKPGQDRAMVFQRAELLPWRSALRNVTYGLEIQGLPAAERESRAEHYLELVGLAEHSELRPLQMSGGMQQRVGLARALAIEPDVLLMDEPFGALDAQTRESLQESLLEIHARTGKTILFVTHDLDEAVLLADRVVVMSPSAGPIQEIVEVDLPRPRSDTIAIKASETFVETRSYLWTLLKSSGSIRQLAAQQTI
jgi:NitT/TauT family transport system ATP-binding protein